MSNAARIFRADRHPAETYEDILDRDTRPVPAVMREGPVPDIGTEPVATARYFDRGFFEKEIRHVWFKTWQIACRVEELRNPGDIVVYDLLDKSLLVTRTEAGAIKAFYNSCLHRSRKLATASGCKKELRCPFHGLTWAIDGSFRENPIAWDFPQFQGRDMSLPEVRVGAWGGFVFINFDSDAGPLEATLGPLIEHFPRWSLEDSYKAVHVGKVVRANWKVVAEAFMESHHALATHPQILPYIGDVNSQYDILSDTITRQFSAIGVVSPILDSRAFSPSEICRAMIEQAGGMSRKEAARIVVPEGETARAFMAQMLRDSLSTEDGHDYADASDAEMVNSLLYNIWPNMSVWAGHSQKFVYRWRPNGLDTDSALMEVMILRRIPKGEPCPPASPYRLLSDAEQWLDAPELGGLAPVFQQDMSNLQYVQEGLRSSGTGFVHFSRYSEMRIRHLHQMIDRAIGD